MFDEFEPHEDELHPLVAAIVRTVEGAAHFDLPIGSKIVGKARARLLEDADNLIEDDDGGSQKIRVSKKTHTRVATLSENVKAGDIITSKTRGPLIVHESKLSKDADGKDVNELHLTDHQGKARKRVLPAGRDVGTLVSNSKKPAAKVAEIPAKDEKPTVSVAPTAAKKVAPTPKVADPEPKKAPAPAADTKADKPNGLVKGESLSQLTDAEYKRYTAELERKINAAISKGLNTDRSMTLNGDRRTWNPERAVKHKEIVDSIWKSEGENVPREGKAVMAGGLGGSGKGTVLTKHAGISSDDYLTIDPDRIKEEMLKRDMVPKVPGVNGLEGAALIQKESTHIAAMLAWRAYANKTNVVWDMTMANDGVVAKRLGQLKKNGYSKIDAVFVHVPADVSVKRALTRHRKGMEENRNGKGPGGRYVPPSIIRAASAGRSDTYNHQVFQRFKNQFDEWVRFDNSEEGASPRKLDGTGKWKR